MSFTNNNNNNNNKKEEEPLSDEKLRKLLKPDPSIEEVLALVKKSFTKAGDDRVELIKELDSYDDRNFWMKISGVDYLVKIHNGVESKDACRAIESNQQDSVVHFQYAIMQTLRENNIAASFPVHLEDTLQHKEPFVQSLPVVSKKYSPCKLVVSLYTWVQGITMSSLKVLPLECIADAGQFLGKLHQKLDFLSSDNFPAAKRFHQWDGKHTKELSSFLYCIQDESRRTMVESVLKAFDQELIQSGVADSFRIGINHGDYNDANILMNSSFEVTGVIDFGDSVERGEFDATFNAGHFISKSKSKPRLKAPECHRYHDSPTAMEMTHDEVGLFLIVAMAYSMLTPYGKPGRSLSAAAAFLRGFTLCYPLEKEERQHLVLLIACRLACSVTLGAYSYQQNPENKYLLLHAEPAWKALEFIWGLGDQSRRDRIRGAIDSLFELACQDNSMESIKMDGICCSDLAIPDAYILEFHDALSRATNPHQSKRVKSSDERVITFVTGNKKKLEEVKRILDKAGDYIITNVKIDLPELQGEPLEIAKEKCEEAAKQISGAVITEDTSLCFAALNDLPGPYIKWFLEKCGHDGLNKMIAAYDDKTAYAQTVVAFCEGPGKPVLTFDGRTMGKVVSARGKLDFGWDPIFEPDEGRGKTYAEMSKTEKDSISHRARAFAKLKTFLAGKKSA